MDANDGHTPEADEHLFRAAPTVWSGGAIPVCFDSANAGTQPLRDQTQRLVNTSWGRAANLSFPGQNGATWGPCNFLPDVQGDYSAIAVHFCGASSTRSQYCPANFYTNGVFRSFASARGQVQPQIASQSSNGIITFTPGFTHISLISDDASSVQNTFRNAVTHEFGHALGFAHEQDRPDNNTGGGLQCAVVNDVLAPLGTLVGTKETPFDLNSIMSYCAKDPFMQSLLPTYLTGGDIAGTRIVYSRRPALHGFMIVNDHDGTFAVNAWNGASPGAQLKLHNGCTKTNPDCTWTFERGMLLSDRDPTLAIQFRGDQQGLVLASTLLSQAAGTSQVRTCVDDPTSCQWSYSHGEWLSQALTATATTGMNALNGPALGNVVAGHSACRADNPDCTWTMSNVFLSSHRDMTLAIRPTNGAVDVSPTQLSNTCDPQDSNCTWTFSQGLIKLTADPTLGLNAFAKAVQGHNVVLNQLCTSPGGTANPDCTWTWTARGIRSDRAELYIAPAASPSNGSNLQMGSTSGSCLNNGVNCAFLGRFARN